MCNWYSIDKIEICVKDKNNDFINVINFIATDAVPGSNKIMLKKNPRVTYFFVYPITYLYKNSYFFELN